MSGQRINDHSSWVGTRGKNSVFPDGTKTKNESSSEGAGKLGMYEDTSEAIRSQQMAGTKKIQSHQHKNGTRN